MIINNDEENQRSNESHPKPKQTFKTQTIPEYAANRMLELEPKYSMRAKEKNRKSQSIHYWKTNLYLKTVLDMYTIYN